MDFQTIYNSISMQAEKNSAIGDTVKFVLDDKCIYIDGSGEENLVSTDDIDANCTIKMSMANLGKIIAGDLNPMMAMMTGKMKISGDMGLAMKLQSLI